jgi:uncharacterized membrane protein YgdD (TMEM256/DUF423 family)
LLISGEKIPIFLFYHKIERRKKGKRKNREPRYYFWGGVVGHVGTLFFSSSLLALPTKARRILCLDSL